MARFFAKQNALHTAKWTGFDADSLSIAQKWMRFQPILAFQGSLNGSHFFVRNNCWNAANANNGAGAWGVDDFEFPVSDALDEKIAGKERE